MKLKNVLKASLVSLILTTLPSCQTQPIIVNQLFFDGESCFSRPYKYSPDYIGPLGESQEIDIENCYSLVGYEFNDYQDVTAYAEENRLRCLED